MEEVLDGVFHWKAVHPRIQIRVDSHFVSGSGTAIDPLLPEEGIEWFEGRGLQRVVLSNRHHLRHAPQIAERFGCPILCHESGLHEFEGGPQVSGFAFGDRLCDDIAALEMDAICPDDTVLRIEAGGGALLFADSLINYGGVGFVPDNLIGDDPEGVKSKVRERCSELAGEEFEHLLFAHGDPLLGGGREALKGIADG
jgi:hypothetical protein